MKGLLSVLAITAVVLFMLFWIGVGIADQADAGPGSTPDWIAAVATLAAFGAAALAGWYAHRALRVEQDRDQQHHNDVRQRQAVQVAVWGSTISHRGPLVTHTFGGAEPDRVVQAPGPVYPDSVPVTIKNASPLPVFNLSVELYVVRNDDQSKVLAGSYLHPDAVVGELANVEIMTTEMVETVISVLSELPGTHKEPSMFRIGWSFQDVAGVRWRRLPDGQLCEQPTPSRIIV